MVAPRLDLKGPELSRRARSGNGKRRHESDMVSSSELKSGVSELGTSIGRVAEKPDSTRLRENRLNILLHVS